MDFTPIADSLRATLDAKTAARERGLVSSRSAIRSCGNAIRALHRYETDAATALLDEAQAHVDDARSALGDHPDMLHAGFVHDAEKELTEARITFALITGAAFPTPDEVGVPASAYLKGMAESIGEMRRHILDLMRKGELARCEELLRAVDDMYYVLVSMDYPDGITLGLRRLTDVARSIIERTRGDFTTSTIQSSLREALQRHGSLLTE
ncbi:MAG TPA: haloacid dehalogenase [Actinomycetota bacterium]|nr:haloacid dehalogenase [Actinomycetota bacterium]